MSYYEGARSKDITTKAFWKLFDVTEKCKLSGFATEKIPGYSAEWIRYCYFELTKPEYIKVRQRVIVLKKVYK